MRLLEGDQELLQGMRMCRTMVIDGCTLKLQRIGVLTGQRDKVQQR